MEEVKNENENYTINNLLLLNPVYNIDLFTNIPKEKNPKSKNLYLNFYNEHTKKNMIQKKLNTITSNRYYEKNMDYIKQKQIKNKIKKEKEEKIKNQIEKEKSLEYRQKRMNKLYSSKNILNNNNNNIISKKPQIKKIKKIERCKSLPNKIEKKDINKKIYKKPKLKCNLSFDNNLNLEKDKNKEKINLTIISKNITVMTQSKYKRKLKIMIKLSKIYENELNLIKEEKMNNIEKENNLILLLNSINEEINKFKNKIDILIIE